jgi:hypothetical protein
MDIKKFENEEPILWNEDSIKKIIKDYKERITELEEEMENSSYPPGEQEAINKKEGAIEILQDLIYRKSWYFKHFYNK